MNKIFIREIDGLKERILRLASEIEMRMETVFKAIETGDHKQLVSIIDSDREIDAREVEIEEECLKILALHQPVARDLRFVVAVMKINNDLERVGDILINIADRGCRLDEFQPCDLLEDVTSMSKLAAQMLRDSLASLISLDVSQAIAVIRRDDELDAMNMNVIRKALERAKHPDKEVGVLFIYHSMARDIERIGDHATNIAEDVAYLADGWIIRHGNKNFNTGAVNAKGANNNS